MKLQGRAWLEFEVTESAGKSTIRQTTMFDPLEQFAIVCSCQPL